MDNGSDTVLQMHNVCKSYFLGREAIPVLFDITLRVRRGEFVAIMGHSGAGKSTLLNILGCLDTPTSGEYLLNGISVRTLSQARLAAIRNREIGFVFQNFNLLPKLDVAANVELPLIYSNTPKKQRRAQVDAVLKRFGLYERRRHKPNEVSGGQKQRVAIARALVKNPTIILADEPTGNLDSHTTEEIMAVFDRLHQERHTILLITHEKEVADHASRVLRIADGRIAA